MFLIKRNLSTVIILCFILFVSLFLRLYDLNNIPLGFHIDEASLGYNGYSLSLTGRDENNNTLPLYVDMFGDNRPSGYHYLTIVPINIFGLNEFSTRFPSAFLGALIFIPFFFLTQILFKNKKISLIASLLISIAPWSVVLSRASAETVVAIFFIILGYSLLIFGIQNKQGKYFLPSSLVMSISFFLYHTPRVFVPLLFLASLIFLYPIWGRFTKKLKLNLLLSFFLLSIISFSLVFIVRGGTGRFSQVNIFGYPEVRLVMEEQIREDGVTHTPAFISRVFHNKPINYSLGFMANYFEYFSGKFLFFEGGLPNWYRVPAMGLIYLVELPFILIGIYYLFKSKDKYSKLPIIWLFIAPVTAAITVDDIPNIQRAIVMFPMLELIAAYGFFSFAERFSDSKLKYNFVLVFFGILLTLNMFYFLHQYFVQSQVHKNWYRYEGFNQMMDVVKKDYSSYNKIVISKSFGGIYPLVLFYMKFDPSIYQKEGSPKDKDDTGFGKFFFVPSACPSVDKDPKVPKVERIIFIDNGTCPNYDNLKYYKHSYVYRKDGLKAFRIVYE